MTTNYVRLVRNQEGVIVDSFDADAEFNQLHQRVATQEQLIKDLRELLDTARQIALSAVERTVQELRT
jgi:archaellum biogenesis ATPase FlaH